MVKRYEKYIGEYSRIEEEVRKRNVDRKTQAEIDSVQKLQHFQNHVTIHEEG